MNIKEKIAQDIKESMKAKDAVRLETVRSISLAITTFEKASPGVDLNIAQILRKLESQRKQSIAEYSAAAGGESRAEQETKELTVIQEYIDVFLPKQLSDEEITQAAKDIIAAISASKSDIGKVMGEFKKKYGAGVDMKKASEAAKALLV